RAENGTLQLRHLISEMAKIAKDTFPKSISLSCQMPKDLWQLEGDATELHQVLMNLCVNARDAMPKGGQLTLSAENITLSSEALSMHPDAKTGPYVVLSVADSGTG